MATNTALLGGRFRSDALVSERIVRFVLFVILVFYTGGLGGLFGPDEESLVPGTTPPGNPAMQIILTTCGACSILLIVLSREATLVLFRSWPIYLLAALALLSTLWSAHRYLTLRRSVSLILTLTAGTAIGGRMRSDEAIAFTVRAMALICWLCIAWVIAFPKQGMHNATDVMQSVHAGLWRGIFGHKVYLGYFSGLTFSLLLFYRGRIWRSRIKFLLALAGAGACMVGSQSANAVVMAAVMPAMLFVSYVITALAPPQRRLALCTLVAGYATFSMLLYTGSLAYFVGLLGKDIDLTGRTFFWPVIYDYALEHGPWRGFGYSAAMTSLIGSEIMEKIGFYIGEAHNGFLETFVSFGYLGSPIVFGVYLGLFLASLALVARATPQKAAVAVFPLSLLTSLWLTAYNESVLMMYQNIWSILLAVAMAILAKDKIERARAAPIRERSPLMRRQSPSRG